MTAATLDDTFRALADPHRRTLVEHLSRGPASMSELADPLPITLSAVTQHVKVLEASGLVETAKRGRVRTCRLRAAGLTGLESWVADRKSSWERRFDRLEDALADGTV